MDELTIKFKVSLDPGNDDEEEEWYVELVEVSPKGVFFSEDKNRECAMCGSGERYLCNACSAEEYILNIGGLEFLEELGLTLFDGEIAITGTDHYDFDGNLFFSLNSADFRC